MVKLEVVHLSREVHQRPQRRRPRFVVNACIIEVNDAHVRRTSKVRSVRRRRQRSAPQRALVVEDMHAVARVHVPHKHTAVACSRRHAGEHMGGGRGKCARGSVGAGRREGHSCQGMCFYQGRLPSQQSGLAGWGSGHTRIGARTYPQTCTCVWNRWRSKRCERHLQRSDSQPTASSGTKNTNGKGNGTARATAMTKCQSRLTGVVKSPALGQLKMQI